MDSVWIIFCSIAMFIGGIVRIKYAKNIKDMSGNHSKFTSEQQGPVQEGVNYLTGLILIVAGVGFFIYGITGGTL